MENQIGRNIESALQAIRQSQEWLAKQLGVSDKIVARWISNGQIDVDHATKVAALLKISLEALLGLEDASVPVQFISSSNRKRHVICVDDSELDMILRLRRAPDDVRALATLNLHRTLKDAGKKT